MCDGDKLLVIKDRLLTKVAKRNMQGIVPLFYEMKKAKPRIINNNVFYESMVLAYTSGNIGPPSNLITIVHNNNESDREEALKVVKWLTMEVNFTIDGSKTLYFIKRPKEADKIIKRHTKGKAPNFFQYAKDKLPHQVEAPNQSTMNRIAAKIPDPRIKFSKSISKFDYRMLMNLDCDFSISPDSSVVKAYDYWNARVNCFVEDKGVKNQDMYKYTNLRRKVLEESGKDIDYVVNTLVAYLYTVRVTSAKKGLWDSFGDVIVENLRKNLEGHGKICQFCGKRFIQQTKGQRALCCSEPCSKELHKRVVYERYLSS